MPDQVLGSHLLLEEERRRFRDTVEQLEKQREEAQDEVDELINALRRERDLGDEEIIFLKAQLRGLKYNLGDPEETKEKMDALTQENEDLKDELKKEAYKRKKLKERFIELQSLVNDESVVLVQEIEKRDEEIAELKEELQEAKDAINTAEEAEKAAEGKEERLLEECERLNVTVEHLEAQLKSVQRDIFTYKIILEEKGVNTEEEKEDELVDVKTKLEEEAAAKEDLEGQLEEVKKAVEEADKDLVDDIERKEKMIQQLKRTIDDKEYLYKTREYQLFTENEELKGDIEALKEQLNDQINNPDTPTDIGVPQDKYDQLLAEMDREQKERKKLQNHFKDLKSYVDKDTADLVNEVQKRDEVIESMNDKLNDLDNLERTEAELDYERKQRKIDEMKIAELRAAISKDKQDIVADSEKKSDMIRQLKTTLTDAKTNLERARWKQREIIMDNQKLRETNQALQKALDDKQAGAGPSDDRKVKELTDELKEINRDLDKERELRGQLASAVQALKETLSDDEADLVDEINKRDIIIANLQNQLREDTARLGQQVTNHRRREDELLNDYDQLRDKIAEVEEAQEPIGHHPAIKDLERDMFEDLTRWMTEEVRILETGVRDRVHQLEEMVPLLTSNTGFDQERVHYVKELAAQEAEINDLRHLNQQMQAGQSDSAHNYEAKLSEMADEIADLRKQLGRPVLRSEPIHGSNDSLPIMAMITTNQLEESGLGTSLSTTMDVVDGVRSTPPGQAGPPSTEAGRGRSDETVEKELIGQLRQIYSNLDMCRQDINRTVESFHDRMVRHHPRLQRRDSPSRLDKKNIGHTINSLLEGYHTQVTELITRLNTDSNTLGRRNENLDEVVKQLESNLNQERQRYDQLHTRTKSYRQEIQELRAKLRDLNANAPETHMDGDHANHDLCQAVHELLNDIDGSPGEGRGRTPSIQEFSRLLLPQAAAATLEPLNEAGPSDVQRTPEGMAFKEDCDVIQEKTDELNHLVKGLQERLDAQKQARIEALQAKVKEYEAEMDRLRDIIGNESEKDNEIEALRERNRQMALNLRDTKSELETEERKNATLTDKFNDSDNARKDAVDELGELRRKTREREAYIRQLQENLRNADDKIEEKEADNGQLRADCAELQQKSSQLSSLIKEVETKFVEKSRQYTILERELEMLKEKYKAVQDYADKRNAKIEEMEQDLRDLINENEKLQAENAEANDETRVSQEKVKELESRLVNREELIADLEKASERLADDVEKRDEVLKQMHNEIQKLEAELQKKEEALKDVEEELDKQDAELEALEEDSKTKGALIDKMNDEVEKMKEDIEEVEKTVKEKDDIITELKDAVTSLEKELDDVKEKEREAEADLEEAERELDVAHKNEEELEEQLEDVKNKMDEKQAALDKLADDCDQLKQYIKDLEDTLKEEKAENDELVKETEEQKDRLEEQENDLKRLADIITDLEKELDNEQTKNEDLKEENEELKAELADLAKQKQDILDEVNHAMADMEGEREEYKTTLADLKDYLEAQQNDVKELKQQLVEKPELEHRCMQTDVLETRSARQQTDELETMNVRIQTVIEDSKVPQRSRRVQTDVDPLDEIRSTAVKTVIKSSSLHVLRQMYNTQDTDTQTNVGDFNYL